MKNDQKQKVHVVDDDLAMRFSMDSMLRSVGYDVELYESGLELLEKAKNGLCGCIVLDIRLPGPGGLEVQRRLQAMNCNVPVVFVTGYADVALAVQAMKAKAVDFLTKPFRDQDLLDAISAAMEIYGRTAQEVSLRETALCRVRNLSAREREIFDLLCQGKLGKQIAHELSVSEATVKVHRRNLMQKLGVGSISQLILQFGSFSSRLKRAA